MSGNDRFRRTILGGGLFCALLSASQADAVTFTVLHAFTDFDGYSPQAAPIVDPSGNLVGTTYSGGSMGYGTIYRIAPDGTFTTLHNFAGNNEGQMPVAKLRRDGAGDYFGTTTLGGENYYGTAFRLSPDGTYTTLYSFTGGDDGSEPGSALLGFVGTTRMGGANGKGVVFRLSPNGKETVLHAFAGGDDGAAPLTDLVRDAQGNMYGVTNEGGSDGCDGYGCGTVFKIAPDGTESVIYAFQAGNDGAGPVGGLAIDKAGNLYGTTFLGGSSGCNGTGCGTVFRIAPDGSETVLYAFAGGNDGYIPFGALRRDGAGNLFGTTYLGGGTGCYSGTGCGTVFRIAPDGTETILHAFDGPTEGEFPLCGLSPDRKGGFVGATSSGGPNNAGTVFRISKR